ncbi:tetratricopeptide repeat-containing sulfotransferase family protein [Arenibacterium sp. CAU 1754]
MAGQHASAFKKARTAAKKNPKLPVFQNLAGIALAEGGDHGAAIPYFQRALRMDPNNPDIRTNLILAFVMTGQPDRANAAIDVALKTGAPPARLHYLRALNALRSEQFRQAVSAADKALGLSPDMIDALNVRGAAKSDLREPEAALADFRAILDRHPSNLAAHQNCASRLNELGRADEAVQHYLAMIRIAPHHAFALSRLAALAPKTELENLLRAVGKVMDTRSKDPDDRALLLMAEGIARNRLGDVEHAMRAFDKAHAMDARHKPYSTAQAKKLFEQITGLFPDDNPDIRMPDAQPRPIFVVGLPRSGTTLVEMILTAGDQVDSCGELSTAARLFNAILAQQSHLDGETVTRFAAAYLADLPDLPGAPDTFVDKMPDNYRLVGPLLTAFPNARVINVERDPRDVAVSMWMQRFITQGMNYASRLSSIADEANTYKRYMAHWSSIYPDAVLNIRYEDIVCDLDAASRTLAAHCAIDWTDRMLHPEENQAAVKTASLNQVRQKVHRQSIGRGALLGDRLSEFMSHLDPDLWGTLEPSDRS